VYASGVELRVDGRRLVLGMQAFDDPSLVGNFYAPHTARGAFLQAYAERMSFVEVNATFHRLPPPRVVENWAARTPAGFTFAFKVPRAITHGDAAERRAPLDRAEDELAAMLDLLRPLGPKRGPLVLQFPPAFQPTPPNRARLGQVLAALPPAQRVAVEVRHAAWLHGDRLDELSEHGAALVLSDVELARGTRATRDHFGYPGAFDPAPFVTAPFGYVRIIGDHADPRIPRDDFSQVRIDRARETAWWAEVLKLLLARVEPVFASVNRHFSGHAPSSLRALAGHLGHDVLASPAESTGAQLKLPGM